MAATFPLVAFLILIGRQEQRKDVKTAAQIVSPYILVGAIYAAFRLSAVGFNVPPAVQVTAGALDWITLAVWVVGGYLRYALAPYPLYIYHLSPLHFADRLAPTLLYGAFILGIALVLVFFRRRSLNPLLWFTIFLISLTPVLYFKGISGGVFFAERYLYIPSMAIVIAAAFFLAQLERKRAAALTCAVAGVFLFMTMQRNRDWLNEENLYARTLQYEPEAVNISTSMGEVLLRRGDNTGAQKYFESSLQHIDDPRFIQSSYESYRIYHGLGLAAARLNKAEEAVQHLRKALEFYPQGDGAYTTLGGVYVSQNWDHTEAVQLLEKAINLNPVNDLARDYLGVALVNKGQIEPAIRYFREALEINPGLQSAKEHLDVALRLVKK
jgi:tetratricopeptide (TPR) repeat protein